MIWKAGDWIKLGSKPPIIRQLRSVTYYDMRDNYVPCKYAEDWATHVHFTFMDGSASLKLHYPVLTAEVPTEEEIMLWKLSN